jgi:pyruvate/oxaloacetate carboxyltransferase
MDQQSEPPATSWLGAGNPSPEEVYERMEKYLKETESLLSLLKEGLMKGEEQLNALTAFDAKVAQFDAGVDPIDTTALQAEIEDIRKHVVSLEELRNRVKADIDRVKKISERITEILSQYQQNQ